MLAPPLSAEVARALAYPHPSLREAASPVAYDTG